MWVHRISLGKLRHRRAKEALPLRRDQGQDPQDGRLRLSGHRQQGGLRGPVQQCPLQVPLLRLQRHR